MQKKIIHPMTFTINKVICFYNIYIQNNPSLIFIILYFIQMMLSRRFPPPHLLVCYYYTLIATRGGVFSTILTGVTTIWAIVVWVSTDGPGAPYFCFCLFFLNLRCVHIFIEILKFW